MFIRMASAVLLAACVAGCDNSAGLSGQEEEAARQAYQRYREALARADPAELQALVARDRAHELAAPNAAELLQLAAAMQPQRTRIASVQVSGSEATLRLLGAMEGARASGSVRLVKEDGAWKVSKEDWQIQIAIDADAAPPAQAPALPAGAVRPADYATLLGRWQGGAGPGEGDWTFTFEDGFAVSAQHPSGAYYRGQAAIFWDLGGDANGIRVPPGWSVLDVYVAEASEPKHAGAVSLGTFSRQGDTLKLCGSEPGSHVRTQSFETPPAGVRCLTLARVGDAAAGSEAHASAVPSAPEPAVASAPARRIGSPDGGVSGEAQLVVDGVAQTYPLFSGFPSDTSFKDPRRATVQFKPDDWGSSSGLRLTLDATVAGRHYADGKAIHDQMFNDAQVAVGAAGSNGRAAVLQWIADGGQVFPPKAGCLIEVTSPYTGAPDSRFEGTISGCTVHSAGIDRQLAGVKFAMHGMSAR
jgi:hypothetical protein